MSDAANGRCDTPERVLAFAQEAINSLQADRLPPGEFFFGIEWILKHLAQDHGQYVKSFDFGVEPNGCFHVFELDTQTSPPAGWSPEGFWFLLNHLVTVGQPLTFRRFSARHGTKEVQVVYQGEGLGFTGEGAMPPPPAQPGQRFDSTDRAKTFLVNAMLALVARKTPAGDFCKKLEEALFHLWTEHGQAVTAIDFGFSIGRPTIWDLEIRPDPPPGWSLHKFWFPLTHIMTAQYPVVAKRFATRWGQPTLAVTFAGSGDVIPIAFQGQYDPATASARLAETGLSQ